MFPETQVTLVEDEAAYLEALDSEPDVIISELELPRFSGRRGLELRNSLAPEIPFIIVAHAVTSAEVAEFATLGVTDYALHDRIGRLTAAVECSVNERRATQTQRALEQERDDLDDRWQALVGHAADILVVLDEAGCVVYANQATARLLGHDVGAIMGTSVFDYIHSADREHAAKVFAAVLTRDGIAAPLQLRLSTANGNWRHFEAIGNNRLSDRLVGGIVVSGRDVTERIQAEELVAAENAVLERIAAGQPRDTVLAAIAEIIEQGAEPCDVRFEFATGDVEAALVPPPARTVQTRISLLAEGRDLGTMTLWCDPQRRSVPLDSARIATATNLATLFAQSQHSRTELVHRSLHDPLTELGNRTFFLNQLDQALIRDLPFTVMKIDIDHLSWINSGFGQRVGDAILRATAGRVVATVDSGGIVARIGGASFGALISRSLTDAEIDQCTRALLEAACTPVVADDGTLSVSVSIGTARSSCSDSAHGILGRLESAVNTAKRAGRDRASSAVAPEAEKTEEDLTLQEELRGAITRDELVCHFQPIIDLVSGVVVAAEALVRWQHPTWGLLHPARFMPLAARSRMIEDINRWMFNAACAAIAKSGLMAGLTVAINASGRDLMNPELAQDLLDIVRSHDVETSRLAIEVTEADALIDISAVRGNLDALTRAGIAVHLDDFGTGYSALSYLHQLPVDTIKIDRSFVQDMTTDAGIRSLVSSIIAMARALGLRTIAEGVETRPQADLLTEIGADCAQGFLYSHPIGQSEFERWVAGSSHRVDMRPDRRARALTTARSRPRAISTTVAAIDPQATAIKLSATRALLRVEGVEGAVGVCITAVRELGGWTIPARLDDGRALPIDCSFGHGEPLLPIAESGLARMRLEQILPEIVEDAREAIARIRHQADLDQQANTDPLTGLLNRRAIEPILRRLGPHDAVVILDLDSFKAINDTLGHAAGDDVIIAFSRALRDRCRAHDHFARLGGDELLAVITDTDADGLDAFSRRLHSSWDAYRPHEVTYSAGAAWVANATVAETLAAADAALYTAKDQGGNRLVVAPQTTRLVATTR